MKKSKKILILGSNSEIARDIIKLFDKNYFLFLITHRKKILSEWLKDNKIKNYKIINLSEINKILYLDIILNFVGSGDPKKTSKLKENFIVINNKYDDYCINYLKKNNNTKYIYFSSGSIFSDLKFKPVTKTSKVVKKKLQKQVYKKIKYITEKKHRSFKNLKIYDLRLFNYFSSTQNINNTFFINLIIKSILKNKIFETSSNNFYRDYIGPNDLFNIIIQFIKMNIPNNVFDIYSKKITNKIEIIDFFKKKYKLKVKYTNNHKTENIFYYSINYKLSKIINFKPKETSIENIKNQSKKILKNISI